jgi:uncharacterized protein (DUF1778 family)
MRKAKSVGLRLTEADRGLLERAASDRGQTLSEFILDAALEKARRVVGQTP